MTSWAERPAEVAHLLNPAFSGFLIRSSIDSYTEVSQDDMPFALAFLVLPLVLHMRTRDSLPNSSSTTLIAWLEANPEARIGLDERIRSLMPFTRESVIFLIQQGLITLDNNGNLKQQGTKFIGSRASITRIINSSNETKSCVSKANLIGKWFAQTSEPSTIYALLGIRP
jgi:hypothetical protein